MDKNLKNEIASAARDILQPVYMGLLRNQDDTLISRGGAKGLAIYDDIERDAFAHAVINKRKMAVASFPWEVEPATEALRDRRAAELVKAQLTAINFDKLTVDLLDATLKGFSVGEVVWASNGSQIYIERIIPRNQRRFVFDEQRKLRLLTMSNMLNGEELPDRKFVVHSAGGKDGSPYGLGLGSKLFWPTFFKRQNITFWLTFADKFGSPTPVGKYPGGTSDDDQKNLLDAISSIAQESGVIIPDNMVIELLEASRGGAGDFYERMCRYMDEQISVAVLGETMTTMAKSAGLGSSQSDVQNDVRLELARADADLLTGTLQETLVRWIVELNMPGANIPRVWRKIEQQEDLNARAERDTKVKALGFKPTLDYITETYGEGWEVDTPSPDLRPPSPTARGVGGEEREAAFAETARVFPTSVGAEAPNAGVKTARVFPTSVGAEAPNAGVKSENDPTTADQTAREDQLSAEAAKPMNALIKQVQGLVNKAENLETLRDDLIANFADLETDKLANVMAMAFAAAELAGMADVSDGS